MEGGAEKERSPQSETDLAKNIRVAADADPFSRLRGEGADPHAMEM